MCAVTRTSAASGDYRLLLNAPFDIWLVNNIPLPLERTAAADTDGDGIPHLLEYLLGTNPGIADPADVLPLPLLSSGGPAIEFEIADPPPAGVVCELETGTLTSLWQTTARLVPGTGWTGGVTAEILPPRRGGSRHRLTLTAPLSASAGRIFARLRISLP